MEIAIYGGAFNPPTRAHEAIAKACLELASIDEVWLMPSGDRMDKQFGLHDTDRCWMLDYMRDEVFDNNPRLKISRFEMDNFPRPTQTYKTVEGLTKRYPENNFQFVFGADSYAGMPNWQEGERLQRTLGMLIVPRAGIEVPTVPNITMLEVPEASSISSTEIRNRAGAGLAIDGLVCQGVSNYIKQCGLYQVK